MVEGVAWNLSIKKDEVVWALLPRGEGGPGAKRKGRMRGQFQ